MSEGKGNDTAFIEGFSGPDTAYAWIAQVSREPSEQGLDGGRIQYLNITKWGDNSFDAPIARYENGMLRYASVDSHAAEVVNEIKESFSDRNIGHWRDCFPQEEKQEIRISRSGSRTRSDSDGRER
ncbi:hypothetical protein D3227_00010 [Mesorhizobium waimense]|uniref:DUF7678 domain-containing protein n=1 Tax=Mesorhizobium waimense TaxID=1300307 RepID=A0A3A5L3G6_9HYPH|nr:hypothetical protein [Mesorhizobium waimense]RJT42309.1 hypothetical protein D3227_00010 [Mesorhizobium waimense]